MNPTPPRWRDAITLAVGVFLLVFCLYAIYVSAGGR